MLLATTALAFQGTTVDLYRGASLGTPGYWAVSDAYLDKAEPAQDHGGGFTLLGGEGKTILIRFGDLARIVGKGRRVTSATLILTPSGGDVPKLDSVKALDAAWGEGPVATFTKILATVENKPGAPKPGTAARGAATWNERRAGIAAWPSPGAPGGTAIVSTGSLKEKTFEIANLGATVQGWIDRPWTDQGLALDFSNEVEFFSSQSPSGRPRLRLTTEPIVSTQVTRPDLAVIAVTKNEGKWSARVKNVGSAPAAATKAIWWVEGKAGAEVAVPALAPDAEATLAYEGPTPSDDSGVPTLALAIEPDKEDASSANDRLDVFTAGKPVALRLKPGLDPQAVVGYWNETVVPQSRFSFAPEGVRSRVRLDSATVDQDGAGTLPEALRQIGGALGLPSPKDGGDLYPGLMGYGDTRFEGGIPGRLAVPYEPYFDAATETALLEPTGLLSASDVGRLNDPGASLPLPKAVLLRVLDLAGRPLPGLKLTIEQPGARTVEATTGAGGTVLLPPLSFKSDLSNGTVTVRGTQQGVTETTTLKAWRISDAFRRSGQPAIVVDARLNLPMLPLESTTNLATDKVVTDSAGDAPTKLAAITDGDDKSAANLPDKPESWVEVDLGRDRTLGEIALKPGDGPFWNRYEIRVYGTGTRPEEALIWATELNSDWTRRNRSQDGWIAYRSPVQRIRFVRVISKSGGPATLGGLRVVPIQLQPQTQP